MASALHADASSPAVKRTADGLLYLMGHDVFAADTDPARAREKAVKAVTHALGAIAGRHPLVLVMSELHWAHDLVYDLIERMLESLRSLPLLVVATARPDLDQRWAPKPGRHNA